MALLTEFLLRASFGLAACMTLVSPRQVTSGYFRNHLYVVLGMASLAALASHRATHSAFGWALAAAALSYVGSVCWLYERPMAGRIMLALTAAAALVGAYCSHSRVAPIVPMASAGASSISPSPTSVLAAAQPLTSGMLLGSTLAAMLLGHWYLNAPGMELAPLRRLLLVMAGATTLHAMVCGAGAWWDSAHRDLSMQDGLFLALRWSFGLVGVLALTRMAWRTLEIPNTQSATGILYVAVIGVFVGETMSLLLSAGSVFPV